MRTSFESRAAIETVASGLVTAWGGACCVSPATRTASAPRVSGSCGWNVATSGPISPAATTVRMSAAAQELAPDAAGAGAVAGLAGFDGVVGVGPDPGGGGTLAVAVATEAKAHQEAARTRTGRRIIPRLVSSAGDGTFRLPRVAAQIEPEPDEVERRAILAALEGAKDEAPSLDPYRSRWRELGVEESVEGPDASDEG